MCAVRKAWPSKSYRSTLCKVEGASEPKGVVVAADWLNLTSTVIRAT